MLGTSLAADRIITVRSRTGQFIVRGAPATWIETSSVAASSALAGAATNRVHLDPALLAFCCERVKETFLHELGLADQWRGKVYVNLTPALRPEAPLVAVASRFADGWQYELDVPRLVEQERLLRALAQTLLLEVANRTAETRSAELPPWLVEGLAALLPEASERDLVISRRALKPVPDRNAWIGPGTVRDQRAAARLDRPRQVLSPERTLTFDQLSFPTPAQTSGEGLARYQASAQLLVHELLQMPGGQAAVQAMLAELPRCLNWQTAFLRAFHSRFPRLLDVEKWWAVTLVNFFRRDDTQMWSWELSLQKLTEALHATASLPLQTNELPARAEVPLQTIVAEWDFARQKPALEAKLQQLQLLRANGHPAWIELVDSYLLCLLEYVDQRGSAGYAPASRLHPPANPKLLAQETVRRLDALDARRAALAQQGLPASFNPPLSLSPSGSKRAARRR